MPNQSTSDDVPIHFIREGEAPLVDGVSTAIAHAWGGAQTEPDSLDAITKVVTIPSGKQRYYVKRSVKGFDASQMFNPQSPMRANGKSQYEFKEVSRDAYEAYMRFMSTGNIVHLRHAERA